MGFSKIIQSILIVLVFGQDVSSLTLETKDVVIIKNDDCIILNCTYKKDQMDTHVRNIKWQKQIGGKDKNLAIFFPPGGSAPFIYGDMQPLYKNRTELIAPNTSLSSVMIIKDPVCNDEGRYQCQIEYFSDNLEKNQASRSVVRFKANASEPDEFVAFPVVLEENQSINLTCSADVGSPLGYVQILKLSEYIMSDKLIFTSNLTSIKTENCTEYMNVTTTYTVTRKDNGAVFRCSSQNGLTEGPGLRKESSKIIVFYGASNTRIETSFSNSRVFIGDHVNLECISDGNPNPNYTWKFNFTDVLSDVKYTFSDSKSGLSFTITNFTDSGYYQCVTSNYFNEKVFNSSSNVTITVQEKKKDADSLKLPCSENTCSIIENCILVNDRVSCSFNIWSVIAFPFIALSFILCTVTLSLIFSRIKQTKKGDLKKGLNIGDVHVSYTRETFEDFGGYADPKDVKRPENSGQIKSDNAGRDNPYADPVDFQTQYAVVQKNWETPAKSSNDKHSSNPSNLTNNTDSSKTGNPSSSLELPNTKNSTSDEKTLSSTETSETIPKPPNVYDGAWV